MFKNRKLNILVHLIKGKIKCLTEEQKIDEYPLFAKKSRVSEVEILVALYFLNAP